jgi:hypothetical protein
MLKFGKISEIDPAKESSWADKVFLTLDLDWAADDVIRDSIDILERARIPATWFITRETALIPRLRENPNFELGIHPNFNRLLFDRDESNGRTPEEIVQRLLRIVPEAVSVRSHSMTQSTPLLDFFCKVGLTHDCNTFVSHSAKIPLAPWRHWNGMIKVPYFWEDDVHLLEKKPVDVLNLASAKGLKVFDFHPIHIALNSAQINDYELTRDAHMDFSKLVELRRSRNLEGSRDRFERLIFASSAAELQL